MLTVDQQGNIEVERGDGEAFYFDITDAAGVALDVSAWSWALTVKRDIDDVIGDALFQKTGGGGGITVIVGETPGVTNRVHVQLSDADTQALAGDYVYDCQGNDGTYSHTPGRPRRFRVRKDVTTPGTAGQPSAGVIVFPGGMFAIGDDGTFYMRDTVTLNWSAFRVVSEALVPSASQSPTIPFWN